MAKGKSEKKAAAKPAKKETAKAAEKPQEKLMIPELVDFDKLLIGSSVVIMDISADEVRDYIKNNEPLNSVGNRVVDVGGKIITVIRTKGRVSKMKEALIERLKGMHPFQRLVISGVRLDYARSVLKDYNEEYHFDIKVRETAEGSKGSENEIEIYQDVFDSRFISSNDWTAKEMVQSFVTTLRSQFTFSDKDLEEAFDSSVLGE